MYNNGQGFYITLPNDSSEGLFPQNTPSEYTTKLPRWIQLNGDWEIGLHSITYTQQYIAQHLDTPISFTYSGDEGKGGKMKKYPTTVHEYISNINKSLKESPYITDKEIQFNHELNGKITIDISPGYKVFLRREQAIVLGFLNADDSGEVKEIATTETGAYQANLHRETNIYVYCDIAQSQIVGDKTVPLLGIVPYEKTIESCEKIYAGENIRYIPVQMKSFQNIKVHLRSSTNEPIPFDYGRASVTLHLRPLNFFLKTWFTVDRAGLKIFFVMLDVYLNPL